MIVRVSGALVASIAVAGCGSSSDSGGGATTVVTVIKEQKAPPSDAGSGAAKDPGHVSDGGTGGDSGGGKKTIPDEVGNQLQAAQDDLQAHGFYSLSNEDATGQDRFLVFDRNWKVVDQDPPGGTRASEDTHITL